MTTLTIYVTPNYLTAVEVYCGDDVKYVETFYTWGDLLRTLAQYLTGYALIEIKVDKRRLNRS